MADDVTRDEFTRLTARVSVVEQEVEGEKLVSRHILEQTRRNTDEVAGLKVEVASLRKDLGGKIVSLEGKIDSLVTKFPRMVADTMREVLGERKSK